MDSIAQNVKSVSPVDALWTLIMGQSKMVQKTIKSRLEDLYPSKTVETPQQKYVRKTLTRAIKETQTSIKQHKQMPSAYDLLNEL